MSSEALFLPIINNILNGHNSVKVLFLPSVVARQAAAPTPITPNDNMWQLTEDE